MLPLFPIGALPSRRWRPVATLELVATAITLAGVAVQPGLVGLPAPGGTSATVVNPFGVTSIGPLPTAVLNGTLNGVGVLAGLMQIAACAALVIRYHSGDPVQRQQIKWITLLAVVFAIFQGTAVLGIEVTGDPSNPVTTVAYLAVPVLALFGLPAVLTLAILKHGLYQIDVILNRAVKYGLLSASLTAVYAGIVLGIGTLAGYAGGPVLTVAAAVVIAVLFQPARARAQHVANRLIYGPRAAPYQVLADFAEDMAGQLDVDVTLDRMAPVLAAAIGADRMDLWVRVGGYLTLRASWPPGSAPRPRVPITGSDPIAALEATRAIAVRHRDEVLGAIAITKPRSEPVGLTLLEDAAADHGEIIQIGAGLRDALRQALDDLRALARGIYPPLLADEGLAAAVRGQADRAPLPVRVEADGIGRHPPDVEAATYFCVLEALQNVAKYAHASQATIVLSDQDGQLRFSVTDDGSGFDATTTTHGTGLQGTADRLAVAGGTLRIRSAPGLGTTISGTLPAARQDSRQQTLTRSSRA
jgi:signal transduction histidine kinase